VQPGWCCSQLSGRLVEISGRGAVAPLSAAVWLLFDAQRRGDPVAWVTLPDSVFYPPDVAASGIDLEALVVVRVPRVLDVARAAARLLRSGAFGVVVLDLLGARPAISEAAQGRLTGLAQRYDAVVLCLTEKAEGTPSLGSMVSLRTEVQRLAGEYDRFPCQLRVLKDKRRGPTWSQQEVVDGPPGLR
ncbi:MAG: recombinase A, partial [Myxococcales bacterium]|nr:recombinase A [Myxococcales bacterium]